MKQAKPLSKKYPKAFVGSCIVIAFLFGAVWGHTMAERSCANVHEFGINNLELEIVQKDMECMQNSLASWFQTRKVILKDGTPLKIPRVEGVCLYGLPKEATS